MCDADTHSLLHTHSDGLVYIIHVEDQSEAVGQTVRQMCDETGVKQ